MLNHVSPNHTVFSRHGTVLENVHRTILELQISDSDARRWLSVFVNGGKTLSLPKEQFSLVPVWRNWSSARINDTDILVMTIRPPAA
jgi:hypothetical protein